MDRTRIVALLWHQRTCAIDTRERLLASLRSGDAHVVLGTCHRVELYAALAEDMDAVRWIDERVSPEDAVEMTCLQDEAAVAHVFAVAAGLDSAVVGEPQILAQLRRAADAVAHPMLVGLFGRAVHVGRAVRATAGLSSARSVGSLAVELLVRDLADPSNASVLVIGAGEMGKLALRALVRRVRAVTIANRDFDRAASLAETYGARAIALGDVGRALREADAVLSAADTRGAVLCAPALQRLQRGAIVVDVAMPRSVDADGRALLGARYRSVDDLPGARARVASETIDAAHARCEAEAREFVAAREPERAAAIRELRDRAERLRAVKLARALRRLGHLSARDRGVVEAFSANLTHALIHAPTVALRERGANAIDGSERPR